MKMMHIKKYPSQIEEENGIHEQMQLELELELIKFFNYTKAILPIMCHLYRHRIIIKTHDLCLIIYFCKGHLIDSTERYN
jgi:hypothetical protein